jgi:alpha-beta hydrolase superfamily lysophospholipase
MIGSVSRLRTVDVVRPDESGRHNGIAYTLWLPPDGVPVLGGVVTLHGAGSCKENHHGFARAARVLGLVAVAFDARGHGASDSPMDNRAVDDVVSMAAVLRARVPGVPVALRGSSMGGFMALVAAGPCAADAVVAICPASAEGLRRGLIAGAFDFAADVASLSSLLEVVDLDGAVGALDVPVLLMHAEGDDRVPVEHSRELARLLRSESSRLITTPGGHHQSIQHDEEMQAVSLRFIVKALTAST